MKRFILPLILGLSALVGNANAWVGGPFDNGFHGAGLEKGAIYQATFTFSNGSGYCYFDPLAAVVPESGTAPTNYVPRGASVNRSVIYYKGVTYIGAAFGSVDGEARHVEAELNGSSDVTFSATTQNTNNNFFTFSQTQTSVSSAVVSSNRSFTVNGNFSAKVYQTAPSFRFRGKGELVFLSPTTPDSITGLAYNAYSNFINAIINFYSSITTISLTGSAIQQFFQGGQDAIDNSLTGLKPYLTLGSVDNSYNNAKKVSMRVNGTRRYL
jgi:hypothetical protein